MPEKTPPNFFIASEFACHCGCGKSDINPELVVMLNQARGLACQPFKINSGCRCAQHNAAVGGVSFSSHLQGLAVDIAVSGDRHRGSVLNGLIKAGFRRIGLAKNFIHVDIDPVKAGAVWLYS